MALTIIITTMKLKSSIIITTRTALLALAFFLPVTGKLYAAANELPELGDASGTVLSALQETAIAEQILRDVAASDEVLHDPEITDYLQALGARLVANGPDKQQKFNFFVVQDNSINAFAMPGGVIGVHTGLILAANSESEVASVLGMKLDT